MLEVVRLIFEVALKLSQFRFNRLDKIRSRLIGFCRFRLSVEHIRLF